MDEEEKSKRPKKLRVLNTDYSDSGPEDENLLPECAPDNYLFTKFGREPLAEALPPAEPDVERIPSPSQAFFNNGE